MDNIKFRAWDKRKQIMREVAVLQFHKNGSISGIEYWKTPYELKSIHANHINVMQYTGLKDKNGVEIYEGDCFEKVFKMIEIPTGRSFETTEIGVVKFYDGRFTCYVEGWGHDSLSDALAYRNTTDDYWKDGVVIGNIYQNPSLLEEST